MFYCIGLVGGRSNSLFDIKIVVLVASRTSISSNIGPSYLKVGLNLKDRGLLG
jgi:hypothetical protein